MLTVILVVLHVIVSLFLILVVLIQQGKGADLAGAFGGGGSQTAFGARGATTLLHKLTQYFFVAFVATSLTLAGYVAGVASTLPTLSDWAWLGRFSVFKAFDPVEVATAGKTFWPHVTGLGAAGTAGIALAFALFRRRDLPANS